jgi:hypothetical protein
MIGWTANFSAGVIAAVVLKRTNLVGYLISSVLGVAGINFVLAAATNNLEKKQKDVYGKVDGYSDWIKSSWSGPLLASKAKEDAQGVPHLEAPTPDDPEEDAGSGI